MNRLGWLLAGLVFAGYTAFSIWQWNNFVSPSWDLGIFTQLLDRYRNLAEPIVTIKGPGYHLWGDHFHPVLVVLTPLFAVFPTGLTLLIAQNALFAISVVPITKLARERMGRAGTVLAVAYALSWGLANAVAVQFHEIAFAVPFLAFGLVSYVSGRIWLATAWIGALVFVKEDLGLTVAAFAAVMAWDARRSRGATPADGLNTAASDHARSIAPWLGLWGVGWFVLALFVIIPAFNTAGSWDYTNRIDDLAPLEQVGNFLTPASKWITVGLLILLGGVVALRSPLMVLVAPTLAWRFVGNVEYYWGWTWHYSAVLMPIVVVAAIDGYSRLAKAPAVRGGAGVISLASALAMVGTGPIAQVWHNWYVWDPDGSRAALAELDESRKAGVSAADTAQGKVNTGDERLVVASDITHLAYLAPDYEVHWTGSMGEVIPQAWVVELDEPAQVKVEYAARRWGGQWIAHEYGKVALIVPRG